VTPDEVNSFQPGALLGCPVSYGWKCTCRCLKEKESTTHTFVQLLKGIVHPKMKISQWFTHPPWSHPRCIWLHKYNQSCIKKKMSWLFQAW